MYTHKLSNYFKAFKSWHPFRNLLFRKHPERAGYHFQHADVAGLMSYNRRPDYVYGNEWKVKTHFPLPEATAKLRKWRKNWRTSVVAEIASFNHHADSGITDIIVNLSNKTSVNIDYVQVRVFYLKVNGEVYKSEYAEFFKLQPLSIARLTACDSCAGSSLSVHITHVVSSALKLDFCQDSYQ